MKHVEGLIHCPQNYNYWMSFLECKSLWTLLKIFQQHIMKLIFCRNETIETKSVGTQRIKIKEWSQSRGQTETSFKWSVTGGRAQSYKIYGKIFMTRENLKHFPTLEKVMLKVSGKGQSALVRRFHQPHRQRQGKE